MKIEENILTELLNDEKKEKLKPLDFLSLFSDLKDIENINNGYSMAILGESISILKKMKEKSVNLVFADAPYNIGKNFGNNNDKWDSDDISFLEGFHSKDKDNHLIKEAKFRRVKRSETRQGERLTERLKPFRFQKQSSKLVSR